MVDLALFATQAWLHAFAEEVRKIRKKEIEDLRKENAVMRAELALRGTAEDSPFEVPLPPPLTIREAMRRVIDGTPMDCYAVYKQIQTQFPQLPINLENCQVGLRVLKRTGDIIVAGTAPAPRGGHPCTLYTKPVERPLHES